MYLHYKCVPPCFSLKGSFGLNKMHVHMYLCMTVYMNLCMYVYKTLNKLLKLQVIQQNHIIWSFQNLCRGYIFIILQIRKMPEVKLEIFLRNWNDKTSQVPGGWEAITNMNMVQGKWLWRKTRIHKWMISAIFEKHLTNVLDNFKFIMYSWLFLRLIEAYYSTSWKGKHIKALWLLHN